MLTLFYERCMKQLKESEIQKIAKEIGDTFAKALRKSFIGTPLISISHLNVITHSINFESNNSEGEECSKCGMIIDPTHYFSNVGDYSCDENLIKKIL